MNKKIHINEGGSLRSGGAVSGGLLDNGDTIKNVYHQVLKLDNHDFEKLKEIASQQLGSEHNPYFGKLTDQIISDKKTQEALKAVVHSQRPAQLAQIIENHGNLVAPQISNILKQHF